MKRDACTILMIVQGLLFALSIYAIIDAYVAPYESEWLTGAALVPLFLMLASFASLCFFLTQRLKQSTHRLAALGLVPIAVVTLIPLFVLIREMLE